MAQPLMDWFMAESARVEDVCERQNQRSQFLLTPIILVVTLSAQLVRVEHFKAVPSCPIAGFLVLATCVVWGLAAFSVYFIVQTNSTYRFKAMGKASDWVNNAAAIRRYHEQLKSPEACDTQLTENILTSLADAIDHNKTILQQKASHASNALRSLVGASIALGVQFSIFSLVESMTVRS